MKRLILTVAAMLLLMPLGAQAQGVQNARQPWRFHLPTGWGITSASRSRTVRQGALADAPALFSAGEDESPSGSALTAVAAIAVLLIMLGMNALVLGTLLWMMIWSSRPQKAVIPVKAKKPVAPAFGGLGPVPAVAVAA